MNIDKIFEEMQIQVYQYRQRNGGRSPYLIISADFSNELLQYMESVRSSDKVQHKLMGCEVSVSNDLDDNQFIVGEKREVQK